MARHEAQQEFDWSLAGTRKQMLREVRLPAVQKVVLLIIASHGGDRDMADRSRRGCTASQETIGAETGYSRPTVNIAIQQLIQAGLIFGRRFSRGYKQGTGLDLRICWSNLDALWQAQKLQPQNSLLDSLSGSLLDSVLDTPTQSIKVLEVKKYSTTSSSSAEGNLNQGGGGGNLASAPETAGDAWNEAEQAVHAADVALAETAVQAARSRGCTAAEVLAACSYHRSRPDLGGGSLYAKLKNMRPGDRPERGFPPLARSAQLAQRVETATRQEQAQQQAEAQERQRDAETAAEHEARYGPAVDALSPAEIEARLPQSLLRIYRREGTPVGLVRELLLARLAKEATHVPP